MGVKEKKTAELVKSAEGNMITERDGRGGGVVNMHHLIHKRTVRRLHLLCN